MEGQSAAGIVLLKQQHLTVNMAYFLEVRIHKILWGLIAVKLLQCHSSEVPSGCRCFHIKEGGDSTANDWFSFKRITQRVFNYIL